MSFWGRLRRVPPPLHTVVTPAQCLLLSVGVGGGRVPTWVKVFCVGFCIELVLGAVGCWLPWF